MKKKELRGASKSSLAKPESFRIWFHYHKWTLFTGLFGLCTFIAVALTVSGVWNEQPDYCIAYVGSHGLTDDMYDTIESLFAENGTDANHDGEVLVQIRQYVVPDGGSTDEDMITSQLTADINACESYFFILENPESFQYSFGLLQYLNGTLPALDDYSADGKTIKLSQSKLFADALGSLDADSAEFMSNLSIGVRGFWTNKTCENPEENAALWQCLKEE